MSKKEYNIVSAVNLLLGSTSLSPQQLLDFKNSIDWDEELIKVGGVLLKKSIAKTTKDVFYEELSQENLIKILTPKIFSTRSQYYSKHFPYQFLVIGYHKFLLEYAKYYKETLYSRIDKGALKIEKIFTPAKVAIEMFEPFYQVTNLANDESLNPATNRFRIFDPYCKDYSCLKSAIALFAEVISIYKNHPQNPPVSEIEEGIEIFQSRLALLAFCYAKTPPMPEFPWPSSAKGWSQFLVNSKEDYAYKNELIGLFDFCQRKIDLDNFQKYSLQSIASLPIDAQKKIVESLFSQLTYTSERLCNYYVKENSSGVEMVKQELKQSSLILNKLISLACVSGSSYIMPKIVKDCVISKFQEPSTFRLSLINAVTHDCANQLFAIISVLNGKKVTLCDTDVIGDKFSFALLKKNLSTSTSAIGEREHISLLKRNNTLIELDIKTFCYVVALMQKIYRSYINSHHPSYALWDKDILSKNVQRTQDPHSGCKFSFMTICELLKQKTSPDNDDNIEMYQTSTHLPQLLSSLGPLDSNQLEVIEQIVESDDFKGIILDCIQIFVKRPDILHLNSLINHCHVDLVTPKVQHSAKNLEEEKKKFKI